MAEAETRTDPALRRLLVVAGLATAASAWRPADYATWFFELFMGAIGVAVLVRLHPRLRFSPLVYHAAAVHYVILALGAHYTYAGEPLFEWLRESGVFARNHFDRVGHFAQGFTPALVAREALLRLTGVRRGATLGFLAVSVGLAFSAFYELVEWWWVLAFYARQGPEWLGMQGDPWDAQGDMFMALLGASLAAVGLARFHDRSLRRLEGT